MKVRTLGYCLKMGIVNTFKNRMMSFASITTITASILLICIFFSVAQNLDYMIHELENKIGIVVFFEENTEEARMLEIKKLVDKRSQVYSSQYTSSEEAWDNFKTDYFEGREELLVGFEDENPLEDSASLQIFINDITRQEELVYYIKSFEEVRLIREDKEITQVMQGANDFIKYFSVTLIAILVVVSMFLISNTVRLAIELRKREINIMKFIGATDSLIRLPFIIEGLLIGIIGAVIPLFVEYKLYDRVVFMIKEEFIILEHVLAFKTVDEILVVLIPLSLGIGIVIGVLGSVVTIHRHLRV